MPVSAGSQDLGAVELDGGVHGSGAVDAGLALALPGDILHHSTSALETFEGGEARRGVAQTCLIV
jgi:hypothetical protein